MSTSLASLLLFLLLLSYVDMRLAHRLLSHCVDDSIVRLRSRFFFFKNACVSCILHSLCKHFRVFLYCLDFPLRLKGARGDRLETRSQVGCCVCRPNIWTTKREKAAEQSHSTVQIHPIASFPLSTIRFPSVSTLATSLSLFLLRCLPRYPYERVHSCLARWHSGLESLIYGSTQCPCTIAWKRVQLL